MIKLADVEVRMPPMGSSASALSGNALPVVLLLFIWLATLLTTGRLHSAVADVVDGSSKVAECNEEPLIKGSDLGTSNWFSFSRDCFIVQEKNSYTMYALLLLLRFPTSHSTPQSYLKVNLQLTSLQR